MNQTPLTTGGMARAIQRSEDTVRELERRGIIRSCRDSSNRRIFDPDQVQAALDYYRTKRRAPVAA